MPSISVFEAAGTTAQNGTYVYASNLGPAVVAVPANAYLRTLSCFAGAAGATMQIAGLAAVPCPPGGAVTQYVAGGIRGAVNVTFAGLAPGDGYFVDWVTEL